MAVRFDRLLVRWRLAAAAFGILLIFDIADIALYIGYSLEQRAHTTGWASRPFFNMTTEFGFGEGLEYAKSILAACAALACGRRAGQPIFYALAGVNLWLAADNAFRLHEQAGALIAEAVLGGGSYMFSRAQDAGELVYLIAFGLSVLALLGWALRRTSPAVRPTGLLLAAAVMSPGFTGVFVDAFHASTFAADLSRTLVVIAEDGGETMMLSASCALTLGCLGHFLEPERSLEQSTTLRT